jgi:hypothetical protein
MLFRRTGIITAICLLIALISISLPAPVNADGGIAAPYDLWSYLKEGQQIAVVKIIDRDTAQIDLFISILDSTDDSHEVTFFVPLGMKTTRFNALEQELGVFDQAYTRNLDMKLREGATRNKRVLQVLFSGALLTNGAILVPLWAPVLMTGCGATAQQPEASLQTESSRIDIYSIDDDTDLTALIRTTGLAPSVIDTLEKLSGQQIAVVKLQTQPESGLETGGTASGGPSSEPGLHLSWETALMPEKGGPTYAYPLGTGGAWSKPIEITRVYVTAPEGLDFSVRYPKLGSNKSGYSIIRGSNIYRNYDTVSYAVDEARGDFGRVWRAAYNLSNPTEDIVITVKAQSGYSKFLAWIQTDILQYSFLFALIIGLLVWVLAWRFLMHRFLGMGGEKLPDLGWVGGLTYSGINFLFMIIPGGILYLMFLLGLRVPSLAIVFLFMGGAIIGLFTVIHGSRLGVSRGRAVAAFVLTSLCGSGAYLVLALAFAWLVNAI